MSSTDELSRPLEDFEYDQLETFLLGLENDHAVFNLSELDGLVTAIVSGPESIATTEWLPLVLGGDDSGPMLESPRTLDQMVKLIMRHLNATASMLAEDPLAFEPLFMENVDKGKTFAVVDDWCIGYMKGVMMREEQWLDREADLADILSPIPLFTSREGWDLLEQLADRHVEYLQKQVAPAARAAYAYWRRQGDLMLPPEGISVH